MKKLHPLLLLAALWAATANAQTFDDVPNDYWAYNFIEILAANGITAGCGNGNYCPEDSVNRAQMAVFLERGMNGSDYTPPAATGNVFLDVGAGDFAANFIEQLFSDGITAGCGNNNYCPDAEVNRAQMAVFLLRAMYGSGYVPPPASGVFDDVSTGHWAASWIEQLAAEGITSGCGSGNYCPDSPVSRAQMAVFLVRTFSLVSTPDSPPPVARIVDSNTMLPGGGYFSCLGVPPIKVKDGRIAFLASDFYGPLFVVENGSIRRVAEYREAVPGAMPGIGGFFGFDIDGSQIYISAGLGVYREDNGNLSLIADLESIAPPGDEKFGGFYDLVADNGIVTFYAASDPTPTEAFGIYRFDGNSITPIVESTTADPSRPGEVPNLYENFSGAQGLVAFGAVDYDSGYTGLYVYDGNSLSTVASTDTPFAGGRDVFYSSKNSIDENGRVLFRASDQDISHPFYQWLTGSVSLTIDVPMMVTGTSVILSSWKGYWAADTTRIVTQNLTEDGQGNSYIGLYLHQNNEITKILDTSDILDGKAAYDLFPIGIIGESLIFLPWFIDDTCGLYSVDLSP